jgi:hypothetical protein
MYTKQEESKTRQDFWTTFGQYMKPVPGADGTRINWKNYKTGIKHVYFRMNVTRNYASVAIVFKAPDEVIRSLLFDQMIAFKGIFQQDLGEEWYWSTERADEGSESFSKVEKILTGVNVMDKEDWPLIISFLKPRIIALDAFWANMKHGFEGLT